jgi:hypothetical protein
METMLIAVFGVRGSDVIEGPENLFGIVLDIFYLPDETWLYALLQQRGREEFMMCSWAETSIKLLNVLFIV